MKTTTVIIGLAGALAFSSAAFAAGGGHAKNQPSACGAVHGAFVGVTGAGPYGPILGPVGGTPGLHGAVGQQQHATGYNNSNTNCNNGQGIPGGPN